MNSDLWQALKQRLQAWFSQAQAATDSEDDWVELPDVLAAQLAEHLRELASPEAYQTRIQEAIATAVDRWQQNLDAPNSLVVLGSPVEAIAKILPDSLQTWQPSPQIEVIVPLPCRERQDEPLSATAAIQQALQAHPQLELAQIAASDELPAADSLDNRRLLIVIPCLEQCFLRCIDGWQGVEFLRATAIRNRHCFWVLGCNHWAWSFLDFVNQTSAYFNEVCALPELDGPALQAWLDPTAQTVVSPRVEVERDRAGSAADRAASESDEERRQAYWESLAKRSSGVSSIAAALWLRSLRVPQGAIAEESLPDLDLAHFVTGDSPVTLHETKISVPSLPALTGDDRYVLHAILIHGAITRAHLALSLGESAGRIQSRVQSLLRAGIVVQDNGVLSVEPAYYTRLKSELANNNFLVGEV